MHTKFWLENLKEREHLETQGVGERIILEQILESRVGTCGLDLFGLGEELVGGGAHMNTEMELRFP